MRHSIFIENKDNKYPIAILVKDKSYSEQEINTYYVTPLEALEVSRDSLIAFTLQTESNGKIIAKHAKEYLNNLLKALDSLGTKTILCTNPDYFKILSGLRKTSEAHGYIHPVSIKGYNHMSVILCPDYKSLFHSDDNQTKIDLALATLSRHIKGTHVDIGLDVIHSEYYPSTTDEIFKALESLHQYDELVIDIETFSLQHWKAGVGTIAFAWDEHNGIAFRCDYTSITPLEDGMCGSKINHRAIKYLLKNFFINYKGTLIGHNVVFDIKCLIYELFMDSLIDNKGLLEGLEVFHRSLHCTKVLTYLATNSTAGNTLGLKPNVHEYLGKYAQEDINDIRYIPKEDLLRYNLLDCLGTFWLYKKMLPKVIEDNQLDIYTNLMVPTLKIITHMELTGLCLDMYRVLEVEKELTTIKNTQLDIINSSTIIKEFEVDITDKAYEKDYTDRKAKAKNPDKIKYKDRDTFKPVPFNPNSPKHLADLLHDKLGLEVLNTTATGLPSTGTKDLKKHTTLLKALDASEDVIKLLEALIELSGVEKILGTFIKAFIHKSVVKEDGMHYIHSCYNLNGTVSGRASSSGDINMQQLPSNSQFGKLIKSCFVAPRGKILMNSDFDALEDIVNALITKDINKLKIYTDGYCGHCFRSYYYWKERMPLIKDDSPESINSIKKLYPDLRQASKEISFLLAYSGTFKGLMNIGFSMEEAKRLEANYHNLYKESDAYTASKVKEATELGYSTAAFGLRIRTPLLGKTLRGVSISPFEAEAEARTLGNAVSGQSYCQLTSRAAVEFMGRVYKSKYANDIQLINMIHDAIYLQVSNKIGVIEWVNNNLIECMLWDELPELKHDIVKLSAQVDICYPTWKDSITIKNNISKKEILQTVTNHTK